MWRLCSCRFYKVGLANAKYSRLESAPLHTAFKGLDSALRIQIAFCCVLHKYKIQGELMLLIYTTTPTKKEAKKLIKILLQVRLCACVQRHKIKSSYVWQKKGKDTICKESEYLLILKTLPVHYKEIEKLLLTHHSYEIPQIIAFEAKAQPSYENWLTLTLQKPSA
ncbi:MULTISPECIES: divalent-cation tolerance protein CutA [Helicobacter]|nr:MULTISPECIES: divalent-cation tolerance protein CutA [Helicobacter]